MRHKIGLGLKRFGVSVRGFEAVWYVRGFEAGPSEARVRLQLETPHFRLVMSNCNQRRWPCQRNTNTNTKTNTEMKKKIKTDTNKKPKKKTKSKENKK